MKRRSLVAFCTITVTVILALLISAQTALISAQNNGQGKGRGDEPDKIPPPYNPYPPGILPPDINSEIARVLREVDNVEFEALAQLRALPPPTLTGQPPILAHTGQRANVRSEERRVGKECRSRWSPYH